MGKLARHGLHKKLMTIANKCVFMFTTTNNCTVGKKLQVFCNKDNETSMTGHIGADLKIMGRLIIFSTGITFKKRIEFCVIH